MHAQCTTGHKPSAAEPRACKTSCLPPPAKLYPIHTHSRSFSFFKLLNHTLGLSLQPVPTAQQQQLVTCYVLSTSCLKRSGPPISNKCPHRFTQDLLLLAQARHCGVLLEQLHIQLVKGNANTYERQNVRVGSCWGLWGSASINTAALGG